jgi:hypothetical protein
MASVRKFKVLIVGVSLFTGASCQVNIYGPSGAFIGSTQTRLTPAQYQSWNTNDAYFVSTIASNLGFSGASNVQSSSGGRRGQERSNHPTSHR